MLRIATWNINSVRLRIGMVCRFLNEAKPDVLCLQEIKCRDGEFPAKACKDAGYKHMHVVGQKGWHGVAIVSRVKLEPIEAPAICPKKEARIAAAKVDGVEVHNLYVPAGADVPELTNPKFAHKLKVLDRMKAPTRSARAGRRPCLWAISTWRLASSTFGATSNCSTWFRTRPVRRTGSMRSVIWAGLSTSRARTSLTQKSSLHGGAIAAPIGPGTIAAGG
jgi:hypothetical protein